MKYDLIFSIGEACSCTSALRSAKLQFKSYPLDWLFGSDFIGRCKILATRFERFIEKKDLEYVYSERSIYCDAYHNKYNDLTFNHDFLSGHDLSETYPAVYAKYTRRISRLLNSISNSKHILVVYIETPIKNHVFVDDKTLSQGRDIIANAFPNTTVDLLYLSHSTKQKQIIKISNNITRIYDDYKDNESELDYVVIERALVKNLKHIKLNVPLWVNIKRKVMGMIINFIPISKIRHNLKRKYHVK